MRSNRVVLLSNHSLLAAGVQRLLQEIHDIELSVVETADTDVAAQLKRLKPWVIVLDSGDVSLGYGAITNLLQECPKAKVIALDLNQPAIDVYRVQRGLQASLNGLLQAIQYPQRGHKRDLVVEPQDPSDGKEEAS